MIIPVLDAEFEVTKQDIMPIILTMIVVVLSVYAVVRHG